MDESESRNALTGIETVVRLARKSLTQLSLNQEMP